MDKQTTIESGAYGTGNEFNGPGEYYFINGAKAINRTNMALPGATLPGLVAFCRVMKDDILLRKKETHLKLHPREGKIELVVGQHGGYRDAGTEANYVPTTSVIGTAKFTEDHVAVKKMMGDKWEAHALGKHIQKHRHLFNDAEHWSKTVTTLRQMKHTIKSIVENASNDSGQKRELIEQNLDAAPPIHLDLYYEMFEGEGKVGLKLFVAYDVNGSEVTLSLLSDNLIDQEREARETITNKAAADLKTVFGEELPFITMN